MVTEQMGVKIAPIYRKAGLGERAIDFATNVAVLRAIREKLDPPSKWTNGPVSEREAVAVREVLSIFPLTDNVLAVLTDPIRLGDVRAILFEPPRLVQI